MRLSLYIYVYIHNDLFTHTHNSEKNPLSAPRRAEIPALPEEPGPRAGQFTTCEATAGGLGLQFNYLKRKSPKAKKNLLTPNLGVNIVAFITLTRFLGYTVLQTILNQKPKGSSLLRHSVTKHVVRNAAIYCSWTKSCITHYKEYTIIPII